MPKIAERLAKLTAGMAAGLIGLTMAASPAAAQGSGESGARYAPTMLILDASGSMQRPDPAGTMMDAAKKAVHTFVDTAPADSKVGLTVYGTGTGSDDAEKAAGCRDIQVLHKADTLDRVGLNSAVDGVKASGWTPMGNALRAAAAALPTSGSRSIVLVSDGDDTCSPPEPCEVARELKTQGVDLVMHAIGFAVDGVARAQLTCMAQATGGTYTDAADGPALERILPKVTAAALRNYEAAGTPITGTAQYNGAPVAQPGQYLDAIGQKEARYYAVDIPDGATAYFSGTISFPRVPDVPSVEDMNVLSLRVYGRDGRDCNKYTFEQVTNSSDGAALTVATAFDGATKNRAKEGSSADTCKGGGRYYFAPTWDRVSRGVPAQLPIELLVGIEPAATDPGPAAAATPTVFTEPAGAGTPAVGGGSFNVATELDGGGRYTDTLQTGEFVFYKVKLNWGQGLAYRVHYDANGGRGLENVSNIQTVLYAPTHEELDRDFGAYTGVDAVLPANEPAFATVPIRYSNRTSADLDTRKQAVPGWYYIAVKAGSTAKEGDKRPVPIRLDLTVTGTEEAGPAYSTAITGGIFGENATTATAQDAAAGDPAVGSAAGYAADDVAAAAGASDSASSTTGVTIAAAAAVAAVCGIGGWLVMRTRRR
ncbi:vWA domain-containing protein [Prescottella agglutinans]|uniref:Ca-activated chloride channel family protein n=1 Tax=Prescottella agglutinans TaxID=1644129 RepID=A0ABT6M5Y5_9NOCA|nr:VWA domain-containing protein [Prescottella agglutinans]MDH6279721.1 Ca-activated chloride channel family protein [Prescottella agglutinans]